MTAILDPNVSADFPGNHPLAPLGAARFNKLHAAALAMNAAHVPTPAPVDPSAADCAPAVTAPIPMIDGATVPPAAEPARVRVTIGAALAYTAIAARVSDAYRVHDRMLCGAPNPTRRDSPFAAENGTPISLAESPVNLTVGDVPALVRIARVLLSGDLTDNHPCATDCDLGATLYLSNRATRTDPLYFRNLIARLDNGNAIRIGAIDRAHYATRAAERLMLAIRRLSTVALRTAYSGAYAGPDGALAATLSRRADMLAALNTAFPPAPTADVAAP